MKTKRIALLAALLALGCKDDAGVASPAPPPVPAVWTETDSRGVTPRVHSRPVPGGTLWLAYDRNGVSLCFVPDATGGSK